MMLATICTFKALLQTSFLSGDSVPGRWNFDNNGKKYSDQPVLNGLVGHFNLNINREIKAFNSLAITPVDLRIVKRRNPFPSIGIQKIRPPLQHQLAFVQMFALWIYAARTELRSIWLICLSTASFDHSPDSISELQAIVRKP